MCFPTDRFAWRKSPHRGSRPFSARRSVGGGFTAAAIFLTIQLISVDRPPVDPVTVGSPLAGEWWVGHGGHAELVNYHYTRSTQRDALDIMQIVDGSIHRPASTDLTSYYIYESMTSPSWPPPTELSPTSSTGTQTYPSDPLTASTPQETN